MTNFRPSNDLLLLRKEIDTLDQELAEILCKRLLLIHKAAPLKKKAAHVRLEDRIEEIISKVTPVAGRFNIQPAYLEKTFRFLIDESIESEMKEWHKIQR